MNSMTRLALTLPYIAMGSGMFDTKFNTRKAGEAPKAPKSTSCVTRRKANKSASKARKLNRK